MNVTLGIDHNGRHFGVVLWAIRHLVTFGASGGGKSFHFLDVILQVLQAHLRGCRIPLIVVDPHGSLFRHTLAYVERFGLTDRCVVFNPDPARGWTPGLNPLAWPSYSAEQVASAVTHAIHRAVGDQDEQAMTRVKRYLSAVIHALQATDLTLSEAFEVIHSKKVREHILPHIGDYYARMELEHLDAIPDYHQAQRIESTEGRLSELVCQSPIVRRIIGAAQSTISMDEVLERGLICLVNLDALPHKDRCLVGSLITDQLFTAAQHRRPDTGYHALALIDEAADFLVGNPDLPKILDQVRKRRLHVWLALQHVAQVREADPLLYSSVLANCDAKMVFGTSRMDAEQLVGEVFHDFHIDEVRAEYWRTIHRYVEETRVISSVSEGEADVSMSTTSTASTSASSVGSNTSLMYHPLKGGLDAFSVTDSGSSAFGDMSGTGDTTGTTRSRQKGETIVPFWNLIEDSELAGREYRGVEQLKEQRISWLQAQPDRHFWASFGRAVPPQSLTTRHVQAIPFPDSAYYRCLDRITARHGCAVSNQVRDAEISARRLHLYPAPKPITIAATGKGQPSLGRLSSSPTDKLLAAAKRGRKSKD